MLQKSLLLHVSSCVVLVAWFVSEQVEAHGPQMQITAETGKIITRMVLPDGPYSSSLTDPKSLYVIPVREYNGIWYTRPNNEPDTLEPSQPKFYSGPGFAYGYDQTHGGPQAFPAGSQLSLTFTTGLLQWNGTTFVDAGETQLEAFRGSTTIRTQNGVASDAMMLPVIQPTYGNGGAEVHNTVRYRFLGDGVDLSSPLDDGIYLATLQIDNNDPSLLASDPYQFLMHKQAPMSEVLAAVDALGVSPNLVQFVPEPAAIGWLWAAAIVAAPWLRYRLRVFA